MFHTPPNDASKPSECVSNLQPQYRNSLHNSPSRSENNSEQINQDKGAIPKMYSQGDAFNWSISQLSARKALSTDLPVFNGKPEEWSSFISSFIESTKLCGYSNSKNILRLQKCFKEKIRSGAALKSDKLDGLVSYAISVQNLCSTLEASGFEAHKNNPLLLQELVNKIPAQTKLNWAMYIAFKDADISVFSKWLFDIAEAVAKVNPSIILYKTTGNVHDHEMEKPIKSQKCVICNINHLVDECEEFSQMQLSDRWDKAHQFKLCRLCLHKHGYYVVPMQSALLVTAKLDIINYCTNLKRITL